MTVQQLKALYLNFFIDRGHTLLPSASLIPVNDATNLFITAGMQPLVPNLLGEIHPSGSRLVNVQKCLRTTDIDSVGDDTHLTFFEMLGNWSLGAYFKKESITWSWEFLTARDFLNLNPDKLYITCFAGDQKNKIPRDEESARLWQSLGVPESHIFFLGKEDNFWGPVGENGPCGPDTEIFYWSGDGSPAAQATPASHPGFIEIWNNVFMEYYKKGYAFKPLKQRNVDTGMGVERTVAVLDGVNSVYEIDVLAELRDKIRGLCTQYDEPSARIIADHLRAATFLLADDAHLEPSNKDQGYILRRLIRRVVRHARIINLNLEKITDLSQIIIRQYHRDHPELRRNAEHIFSQLTKGKDEFLKTLERGLKEFKKIAERVTNGEQINMGKEAFNLFQSYGFPPEMFEEEMTRLGTRFIEVTDSMGLKDSVQAEIEKHQAQSRTASAGKFKGGLADHGAITTRYHTANHIMLQALREVLGPGVEQRGSNITAERLRFDFSYPQKLTAEQLKRIENITNEQIAKKLPVHCEEMSVTEAKKSGATGVFEHKYGDTVKVYFVGDYSKEICGGPHVANTSEIGKLKIIKEEASSAGVRRIKAILE